jgi:hypothetical protein
MRNGDLSGNHPVCARRRTLRGIFLVGSSRQGTSARLPPCPSQNRTSGFPSIRLFSIDSDQQRPICVRSLGIRFPPLKMGNVLLTRSSMLWRPSLHRHYPTSSLYRPPSQDPGPLPRCLFGLLWHTPIGFAPSKNPQIRLVHPLSQCVARCRRRPRGRVRSLVLPQSPLLPASAAKASAFPSSGLSGLLTGFSFYRFTSQPPSAPCFGLGWSD